MARRPLIVAHRGGAAEAPENTLAACDRALAAGADAVELDVRLSADGVPVCLHDATLGRTTTGRGLVATWTAAELGALDATIAWPAAWGAAEPPPRLDAMLERLRGRAQAFVELKGEPAVSPALVEAVVAIIRELGVEDACTVLSFDWPALAAAREAASWLAVQPLAGQPLGPLTWQRLVGMGAGSVGLAWGTITPARLAAARRAGLCVNAWTLNHPRSWRRAMGLGLDAITTDRPAQLYALLASNCRGT